MGPLFWSIGAFSLFAASIGIVPYTSRLAADVPKPTYRTDSSESGLYAKVVRGLVAVGMAILLAALDQPLVPLVITACLAAVTMFGLLDPAAHHEPALPAGAGACAPTASRCWRPRRRFFGVLSVMRMIQQAAR